ncbi:MAG: ROK family protein [Candidatus Micrarchaeia archaeon]
MYDLVSIVIGSNELMMASIDSNSLKIKMLMKETFDLTNSSVMSKIKRKLDTMSNIRGIGIAASGLLDQNKGIIKYSTNSKLKNLGIVGILEKRYKLPVSLYNVSVASVMGEKLFGMGTGYKNIVYISLSLLITGGVITNDHVLLGKDGNSHEIGHMVVSSEGNLRCSCGSYGHWIAYCSGFGIPNYVRYLLNTKYKGKDSKLRKVKNITAKSFYEIAAKDAIARKIAMDDIGNLNAIGVANAINAYDPELVILGGRITYEHSDLILKPIVRNAGKYIVNRRPRIVVSKWSGEGKFLGAVSDFIQQ